MTRSEFGHWARGVLNGLDPYAEQVAMVLAKAAEVLGTVPVAPRVPSMLPMRIGDFCCHNVRAVEHCDACALSGAVDGVRVYALVLPVDVKHVYVRREKDVGTDRVGTGTAGVSGGGAVGNSGG